MSSLLVLTAESQSFAERVGLDAKASKLLGDLPEERQPEACWDESRTDIRNASAYMSKKCRELEAETGGPAATPPVPVSGTMISVPQEYADLIQSQFESQPWEGNDDGAIDQEDWDEEDWDEAEWSEYQ